MDFFSALHISAYGMRAQSGRILNRGLNFELNAEKNLPSAFTRD